MISDKTCFKAEPKIVSKQKYVDYVEKWPFMIIFLYNLHIFVDTIQLFI